MANMELKYKRQNAELIEEIDLLERENYKLKKKLNIKDDDGVIDVDNDSEDGEEEA